MTNETVECHLCHATRSESFVGNPSHSWRCQRCGQQWDAAREATVANYLRWATAEVAAVANGAA